MRKRKRSLGTRKQQVSMNTKKQLVARGESVLMVFVPLEKNPVRDRGIEWDTPMGQPMGQLKKVTNYTVLIPRPFKTRQALIGAPIPNGTSKRLSHSKNPVADSDLSNGTIFEGSKEIAKMKTT